VGDDEFNEYPVPTASAAFLPGPFRQLGAAISGAPSVGPGSVVAVVAGNTLRLLNASDMSDVAGFAPPALTAPINGRPSFGNLDGASVIAVGTADGRLSVYDAQTGAQRGETLQIGSSATTPAIDGANGAVYVAGNSPAGPVLVRAEGNTMTATPLTGGSISSSPVVFGGTDIVGTDDAVQILRGSGPQASIAGRATISPVLKGDGHGLIATEGNIYGINVVTGTVSATSVPAPAGLADLWYDGGSGAFYGGAADGKVYKFTLGKGDAPAAAGSMDTLSDAITAQVLVLDGNTYAIDHAGNYKGGASPVVNIGGPSTGALAATGRGAGNAIIVSEAGGGIGALGL
jgi:hypothetical protein